MDAKLITALVSIILLLIFFSLMLRGWRSRLERQKSLGLSLPPVPAYFDQQEPRAVYEGVYVSSTVAGDWLDRVGVASLGYKAEAQFFVFDQAVIIARQGAKDILIWKQQLVAVRTEAGINGKFVEKDGLVVLTWNLNGVELDSGFRTRYAGQKSQLVDDLKGLCAPGSARQTSKESI
ncbi:MAG: hypothetical protein Q4C74_01540 [Rothia sp. (in: high G+C Gram-positive bacteria)]|nr:hypothetical protein [Rothia sp. (in: high G+C Gram-positive bacteria)]